MPLVADRDVAVPVNQAIEWKSAELTVDSLFYPFSRTPAVNQANLEALDINNFFDRNSRCNRVHIPSHTVYRVFFEHIEQIGGNHISGMQYHIDGIDDIIDQAEEKCPGFCGVGKVGI